MTTNFSRWESLTLSGGEELEKVLEWFAKRYPVFKLSEAVFDTDIDVVLKEIEFYREYQKECSSSEYFAPPEGVPQVSISTPYLLSEGDVCDVSFPSEFQPVYQPFLNRYQSYPENHTAYARLWRHTSERSLGTVVLLHGWSMGDQRINALVLVPGFFFRMGFNVVVYELPYHGRRHPEREGRKTLFPSVSVARTNEALRQAVWDLRLIHNWLKSETEQPVGVAGVSLGGYTAALWASLDELAFVLPIVPIVSLCEVAWELLEQHVQNNTPAAKKLAEKIKRKDLEQVYSMHSPLSHQPKVPFSARMIVAGLGDEVIPKSQPEELWKHWGEPKIHWFHGKHIGELHQSDSFAELHEFFCTLNLAYPELLKIEDPHR